MGICAKALLVAPLLFCSGAAIPGPLQSAAALSRIEKTSRAVPARIREQRMVELYERRMRKYLQPNLLPNMPVHQAEVMLHSAYIMVFYTGSALYSHDMDVLVQRLEQDRSLTPSEAGNYFRALIRTRRFSDAAIHTARTSLPNEEKVPFVRSDRMIFTGAAYRVSGGADVLQEVLPDLSGTRLLLVTHPLCAFSQRAEAALDPIIRGRPELAKRIMRLAPPGERLFLQTLRQWNAEHPGNEMLLARYRSDWPMVGDWATPHFYLLQHGQVVDHFSGWPREGHEARLRVLLRIFEDCLSGDCPLP